MRFAGLSDLVCCLAWFVWLTGVALATCDFPSHLYRAELSNPAQIDHIGVEIHNSRKWIKNSVSIITSRKLNIDRRYKDKLAATLTVRYEFGTCTYHARVRQSGDWKDHIRFAPGGRVISSVDVRLLEGNILNAVRFKLLLPETRNGLNEVLGTLVLRKLGFIAPETFLVSADINGVTESFMFQENTAKELLERNLRREGPIFEGDESILWNMKGFMPFDLEDISLSRLTNGKWAQKGETSTKMALDAFRKLQVAYLAFAGMGEETRSRLNPNVGNGTKLFENYAILLMAVGGHHALRPHNRKFYFNSFIRAFEPIYYDGNIVFGGGLKSENPDLMTTTDFDFYLTNFSQAFAETTRVEVSKLAGDDAFRGAFLDRAGVNTNAANQVFEDGLASIVSNLSKLRGVRQSPDQPKVSAPASDVKSLAAAFISRVREHGIKTDIFELEQRNNNGTFAGRRRATSGEIKEMELSSPEIIKIMTDNSYRKERLILLPKNATTEDKHFRTEKFLDGEVLVSPGASVAIDANARIMTVTQSSPAGWVLVRSAKMKDWTVTFDGAVADAAISSEQRFNEFGLTGCINFYDINFIGSTITARHGQCEDSINIVASRGTLADLVVEDGFADAVDIDFSQISIDKLTVSRTGNDCFDVSTGTFSIASAQLTACGDKGLSVGENSVIEADRVLVDGAAIGISSKDFSTAHISRFDGVGIDICAEAFQKKQEFGGGALTIDNFLCSGKIIKDRASSIVINGNEK